MQPFTDFVVFRSFQRRADGAFSYLWYGKKFTDTPCDYGVNVWQCSAV